jgi:hypothetical protein
MESASPLIDLNLVWHERQQADKAYVALGDIPELRLLVEGSRPERLLHPAYAIIPITCLERPVVDIAWGTMGRNFRFLNRRSSRPTRS